MRKTWMILAFSVAAVLLASCAQPKYADVNKYMEKTAAALNKLGSDLDAASDAKGVAAAFNTYIATSKTLATEGSTLGSKYPELKTMSQPPKEIADSAQKVQDATQKAYTHLAKADQFKDDPDVKKALAELMGTSDDQSGSADQAQ